MSSNRSLISMNWQEASNGVWYADTTHYRCVAMEKGPENQSKGWEDYTWDALVYKWNIEENSWVQVEKGLMGSRGMQDAQLSAERLLGNVIERGERRIDPAKNLFDQLNRVVENAQMRDMDRQRFGDDPRMRGLPPGHPPIRRRGDRDMMESIGRTFERKIEQQLFAPPSFTFDPARDLRLVETFKKDDTLPSGDPTDLKP